MGIRYIWGKYTSEKRWTEGTQLDMDSVWVPYSSKGSSYPYYMVACKSKPTLNRTDGCFEYSGEYSLTSTMSLVSESNKFGTDEFPYVMFSDQIHFTGESDNDSPITKTHNCLEYIYRRYLHAYWRYFQDYNAPSDRKPYCLNCISKNDANDTYHFYYCARTQRDYPDEFQNWVSSARSSEYPSYDLDDDGYFYYAEDQDIIDPTKVTIPDFISFGDTITITVTPSEDAVASSYGSISYRYEYSTNNGGSWQLINTTTSTTQQFTVPEDATQLKVRVRSSDNIGYTSADYVESELVAVTPRGDLGISGEDSDLGVVKSGFTFMVTSETVSEADVTIATAGHEWSFKAAIGTSYNVDIFDLVTGTNSITITASAQVVNGTISATRTHQYTKLEQTFDPGDTVLINNEGVPFYSLQVAEGIKCSDGKMLDVELGDILSRLKAIESQRKAG